MISKCYIGRSTNLLSWKIFSIVGLALVVVLMISFLTNSAARAIAPVGSQEAGQNPSVLAVDPAIIETIIDPGKPAKFKIQLTNLTHIPLPIKSSITNFTVLPTDLETTDSVRLNASGWMQIDDPDFILQAKQTRVVEGTIKTPKDAIPGGHYATVFFQPLVPVQALNSATVYVSSKIGVLSFLVVKGKIIQKLAPKDALQAITTNGHGPVAFKFSLRNQGNVHLLPVGRLTLFDWNNKVVKKFELSPGIILPDTTKQYDLQWMSGIAAGRYRAELEITDGTTPLEKQSIEFWVVPWTEVIFTVVGTSIILVILFKTKSRRHKAWQVLRGKDVESREG